MSPVSNCLYIVLCYCVQSCPVSFAATYNILLVHGSIRHLCQDSTRPSLGPHCTQWKGFGNKLKDKRIIDLGYRIIAPSREEDLNQGPPHYTSITVTTRPPGHTVKELLTFVTISYRYRFKPVWLLPGSERQTGDEQWGAALFAGGDYS